MPTQLICFKLEDGRDVFAEVAIPDDQAGLVGRDGTIAARQTFEQALSHLRPIANAVLEQISALASRPDEVAIEMGVTLKAEAGVIIAKTAGEGSLKLSIKWKRNE